MHIILLPSSIHICTRCEVLHNSSQEGVYDECARDVVTQLMRGFNGTVLAYGQTGAGVCVHVYTSYMND